MFLSNHVAEVNPGSELYAFLRRDSRIALGHAPLHLNRAAHGVNHARELGNEAVASVFHDPPAVLGNLRIDDLLEMGFEAGSGVPSSSAPIRRK